MKAEELAQEIAHERRVAEEKISVQTLCLALAIVVRAFTKGLERTRKVRWLQRLGLKLAIAAMQKYREDACGTS